MSCRELARLPKAPRFSSLYFKNRTPGSPINLLSPQTTLSKPASRAPTVVDPTHPALLLNKRLFPAFVSPALTVRAIPLGLLQTPDPQLGPPFRRDIRTWDQRIAIASAKATEDGVPLSLDLLPPVLIKDPPRRAISMSFLTAASKKRTHNKKTIRSKITKRIKTALTLLVTRGADAERQHHKLVFNPEDAKQGDKWILPGWSYVFLPTMEIYRMPYPNLILLLRQAMQLIAIKGTKLEQMWLEDAMNLRRDSSRTSADKPSRMPPFITDHHSRTPARSNTARAPTNAARTPHPPSHSRPSFSRTARVDSSGAGLRTPSLSKPPSSEER